MRDGGHDGWGRPAKGKQYRHTYAMQHIYLHIPCTPLSVLSDCPFFSLTHTDTRTRIKGST